MSSTTAWAEKQKRLDNMAKPTQSLTMCDDPAVRDRYQAAKQTAERAQEYLNSLSPDADKDARALVEKQNKDAQAALKTAQAEYDAHTVVLTFQAIERGHLEDLQAEHPATEEDEALGREFNFDTFAPALIAAASVDGMPLEYAANAMKTWTLADSNDLWNAAWSVQQRRRTDLGKG
ncbi:hypothetical protein [Streptomyces collinus]|jgi:hypothetical protein|uniref:hypothetical protein n=1 Tax=Streptomyces collinus TaxID=42684 RepID=UPI0037F2990E